MSGVLCPMLVGRERERAALREAVAAAGRCDGSVSVILGEAGVGKSRLVADAVEAAAGAGAAVLTGRAVASGRPVPLRPLGEAVAAADREEGLPDDPTLAPFLPALGRLLPVGEHRTETAQDVSLTTLAEAVLRLLTALGRARHGARRLREPERSCVLVLEDLHWADAETLFVLEYLADNLAAEPVCCLATVRSGTDSAADALARSLADRRAARLVPLPRLGDADVDHMTRACLESSQVPVEVEEFVRARADGLPFFVEELLAGLVDADALVPRGDGWVAVSRLVPTVPLSFAASIRQRVRTAGATAATVLSAAAVLGRSFDWSVLGGMTGLDDEAVLAALHRGVDLQLMETDRKAVGPGGFRFRHALTRDVVVSDLLPPDHARLAARAAAAVEARYPQLPGAWCELVADLHERAGQRERAAALLLTAARRAVRIGALASAESIAERARELIGDHVERLVPLDETLLEALALAGKTEQVRSVGARLLRSMETSGAGSSRRGRVHLRLSRAHAARGAWDEAERALRAARDLIAAEADAALRARVDALEAYVRIGAGEPVVAARQARGVLAAAERLGLPEVACEALEVIGRSERDHDLAGAEQAFVRELELAERHGLQLWRVRALAELGAIDLLDTARLDRLETAHRAAMEAGALSTAAVVDLQLAAVLSTHLRLDDAWRVTERCAALSRRLGLSTLPMACIHQATVAILAEPPRQTVEDAAASLLAEFGEHPEVRLGVWGRIRALAAIRVADDAAALAAWDEAMGILRRHPSLPFPFRGWWALLRTIAGVDDDAARDEVRSLGTGMRFVRVSLGFADAVAAGRAGDVLTAERRFAEAEATLAVYREAGWYRHHTRRMVATAAFRDGWGQPENWLREALAWFEGHGHRQAASACAALLRRAGVRPQRSFEAALPEPLRALGITGRQAEVLPLVAEGLTNAEIAERLFCSPRTVEKHVASLLRRTGTRRRVDLGALAVRLAGEEAERPAPS